ncbi:MULTISPECIES: DUF7352 domain-containing protein [Nitrincola]|uniref:DUF7352 domain-containing protein n=2 Tax=Nitrincola TaxID=267849 RepID=A0A364NQL8_9GAMM|nr:MULTISPECIES: hypothetical protein [Nitrincola]EXJ11956.1 hypothetical protein D791_01329 [Nitrincola nitratireducens]RAU19344.1 hypothetical protein DN062_03540 [Nitrincola tibetensis]
MKTIRQVSLDSHKPVNELILKEGYRIVKTEFSLNHSIVAWIEEPLRADLPTEHCFLKVIENGQPVPLVYEYVSSAFSPFESKAAHVFKVPESFVREEPTRLSAVA